MNLKRTRFLGAYLLAIGFLQACLYLAMSLSANEESPLLLYYFDPRLGIFFLLSSIRGTEQVTPDIFRWLSAAWILVIGLVLLVSRPLLKTYIVSEIVLMIPNIIFFVLVIWANLSSVHGFSVGELFFPTLVMIVFSIIPLRLAFRSRAESKAEIELSNLNRA